MWSSRTDWYVYECILYLCLYFFWVKAKSQTAGWNSCSWSYRNSRYILSLLIITSDPQQWPSVRPLILQVWWIGHWVSTEFQFSIMQMIPQLICTDDFQLSHWVVHIFFSHQRPSLIWTGRLSLAPLFCLAVLCKSYGHGQQSRNGVCVKGTAGMAEL